MKDVLLVTGVGQISLAISTRTCLRNALLAALVLLTKSQMSPSF